MSNSDYYGGGDNRQYHGQGYDAPSDFRQNQNPHYPPHSGLPPHGHDQSSGYNPQYGAQFNQAPYPHQSDSQHGAQLNQAPYPHQSDRQHVTSPHNSYGYHNPSHETYGQFDSNNGPGHNGPGVDGERGLGATLAGGAAGGFIAHKAGAGGIASVLGSVVGAVGANIIEHKLEGHKGKKKEKKHKSKKEKKEKRRGSKSRGLSDDSSSSSGSDSD